MGVACAGRQLPLRCGPIRMRCYPDERYTRGRPRLTTRLAKSPWALEVLQWGGRAAGFRRVGGPAGAAGASQSKRFHSLTRKALPRERLLENALSKIASEEKRIGTILAECRQET
jgi:hypothetical protein